MAKRTTLRTSKKTKLYVKRDTGGRFEDIQTYKRAHGQDVKRRSKAEAEARAKKAKKTSAKKTAKKRPAKKTAARKKK